MSFVKFFALLALVAVVSCRYGGLRADLRKLQQDLQDGDLSDRIPSGPVSDDDASSGVRDLETFNPPVLDSIPDGSNPFDLPAITDDEDDEAASALDGLCKTAGGACTDFADTKCKAPNAIRRGLCTGASHRKCCVAPGNGGTPVGPAPPAPSANWITKAGNIPVIKTDRSGRFSGRRQNPNKFILHTTDGWWPRAGLEGSMSSLDSTRYWPHFIVGKGPDGTIKIHQYLPFNIGARALRANNAGTIQVEISALSCCAFTDYDPALTIAVRDLIAAVRAAVPAIKAQTITSEWGPNTPRRLSIPAWNAASGLGGHMHSPEPDNHGDPGAVDPNVLLGLKTQPAVKTDLAQCLQKRSCPSHIRDYYKTRTPVV